MFKYNKAKLLLIDRIFDISKFVDDFYLYFQGEYCIWCNVHKIGVKTFLALKYICVLLYYDNKLNTSSATNLKTPNYCELEISSKYVITKILF